MVRLSRPIICLYPLSNSPTLYKVVSTCASVPGSLPPFLQRIFQNLHVVLCFTPLSQELAEVCAKFPGLVMHATVNMYDEWPGRALYGLAIKKMQEDKLIQSASGSLIKVCVYVRTHNCR